MRALAESADDSLEAAEQDQIREAADALFFCENFEDDREAHEALDGIEELAARLVESERFTPEEATRLVADVDRCGPLAVPTSP